MHSEGLNWGLDEGLEEGPEEGLGASHKALRKVEDLSVSWPTNALTQLDLQVDGEKTIDAAVRRTKSVLASRITHLQSLCTCCRIDFPDIGEVLKVETVPRRERELFYSHYRATRQQEHFSSKKHPLAT
jgi:hypothetical protein